MNNVPHITCDSRKVRKGDVFVAVPGYKEDGAKFVNQAVANGASLIVATHKIANCKVPVKLVRNVRRYLGEEVARFYGHPTQSMDVYGVTGTNGKTTTTWILAEFLKRLKRRSKIGMITTVLTATGRREFESGWTTPDAETLQGLFAEMRTAKVSGAVMEVSSHASAQDRVAGTKFAGMCFTNLSQDHLDFHKTMEDYYQAKADLFRRLGKENPGVPAAICIDGEYGKRLAASARRLGLRVMTASVGGKADLMADDVKVTQTGCAFIIAVKSDGVMMRRRVRCPLAGVYNVQNVLVAAAMALMAGVEFDDVVKTISKLRPRWGRLERVVSRSQGTVFVDFAHTDDALRNVLSTVRSFTPGKVWAVFGAGGDRDRAKRPKMGAAAAENADELVVTSDNPRSENPRAIISEIVSGVPAGTSVKVVVDRRKAIKWALDHAKAGDSVVICGKGHERTQTIGDRILPFDDRDVVRSL